MLVEKVKAIAKDKGCIGTIGTCVGNGAGRTYFPHTPAQKKLNTLKKMQGLQRFVFTEKDLADISNLFPVDIAAGQRYSDGGMKIVNA